MKKLPLSAQLNSAVDRCLIDLGFVVPEELEKTPAIGATSNPSLQQQAIADIEQMIDEKLRRLIYESDIYCSTFEWDLSDGKGLDDFALHWIKSRGNAEIEGSDE